MALVCAFDRMSRTTAIVVTFNSEGHVRACIESCLQRNIGVIVVDNASSDGTLRQIPSGADVPVIANSVNRGFAAAVNQGMDAAETRFCLLLNPDARLLTPIDALEDALAEDGHTAASGVLVSESGEPQKGFSFRALPSPAALAFEVLGINRLWPSNPVNRRYRCLDADLSQAQIVEQPAGALLLLERSRWRMDESFHPVWFEDVDLCRRIAAAGGTIWFTPAVRAAHAGGHSVQNLAVGERNRFWYASLLRYAAKHFSSSARRAVAVVVGLVIFPRVLLSSGRGPRQSAVQISKFVWSEAWRTFRAP